MARDWSELLPEILQKIFRITCLGLGGWRADLPLPNFSYATIPIERVKSPVLFSAALQLALVCTRWKEIVMRDGLLKVAVVQGTSFSCLNDSLRLSVDTLRADFGLQLQILGQLYGISSGSRGDVESFFDTHTSRIQSIQLAAELKYVVETMFRYLGTRSTPRLNFFEYVHRGRIQAIRVPAVSLRACHLNEVVLDGVRVDPLATDLEPWHGFCKFVESAQNIQSLTLRNFGDQARRSQHLTDIVALTPFVRGTARRNLVLSGLKRLILVAPSLECIQLLCHLEVKTLDVLAFRGNFLGSRQDSDIDLNSIPGDFFQHVKKIIITIYDRNCRHFFERLSFPSLTELSVGHKKQHRDSVVFPVVALQHLRLDTDGAWPEYRFGSFPSIPSYTSLRSLTLGTSTTSRANVHLPKAMPHIVSLTLYGPTSDIREIVVKLPNLESLRFVVNDINATSLASKKLLLPLYKVFPNSTKQIALLPNLCYLAFFLQMRHGAQGLLRPIVTVSDGERIGRYLQERSVTSGFRRVERLVFNHYLANPLRASLEKLVDTVIDACENGDAEHPWRLDGIGDGKML